jgi:hypothetical protein
MQGNVNYQNIIRERNLSHDIMMTLVLDAVCTYMSPLSGGYPNITLNSPLLLYTDFFYVTIKM